MCSSCHHINQCILHMFGQAWRSENLKIFRIVCCLFQFSLREGRLDNTRWSTCQPCKVPGSTCSTNYLIKLELGSDYVIYKSIHKICPRKTNLSHEVWIVKHVIDLWVSVHEFSDLRITSYHCSHEVWIVQHSLNHRIIHHPPQTLRISHHLYKKYNCSIEAIRIRLSFF